MEAKDRLWTCGGRQPRWNIKVGQYYISAHIHFPISRCGVYCAANACIEQVIQHGEVDVFQAVKTVRRHRPQLVENLVMQFGFAPGLDIHV